MKHLQAWWYHFFVKIYQTFMVSVAVTLGASEESAEKDMKEVHDFELQLANISSLSGLNHLKLSIVINTMLKALSCENGKY